MRPKIHKYIIFLVNGAQFSFNNVFEYRIMLVEYCEIKKIHLSYFFAVLSVFACVFCFCPVGLGAMILAIVARNKWASGDQLGARSLNTGACGMLVASVVCGIVLYLVLGLLNYLRGK